MSQIRKKLHHARTQQAYVRVERALKISVGFLEGFVVGVGKEWALLAQTSDGGWPDGYIAFRLADVKSIRSNTGVSETFARLQIDWPPSNPFTGVDLNSVAGVITGLAAGQQLVGIEKERERDALWIGQLDDIWPKWVWLDEVDSTGTWLPAPLGYRLRRITTVRTGTRYMQALSQVAGNRNTQTTSIASPASRTITVTNCESHHQAVQLSELVSDGNALREFSTWRRCFA